MRKFITTLLLATSLSSQAGIVLTIAGIQSIHSERPALAVLSETLGFVSVQVGIEFFNISRAGWGVFFIALDEETQELLLPLDQADEAEREACLEILFDDSLSDKEKQLECLSID